MSSATPTRRKFVSQQDCANFFGVHPKTVRRWIERGLIAGYKLPGSRLVRVDFHEVERELATIPATTMRAGSTNYGPKARNLNVPTQVEAVSPSATRGEDGGDQ